MRCQSRSCNNRRTLNSWRGTTRSIVRLPVCHTYLFDTTPTSGMCLYGTAPLEVCVWYHKPCLRWLSAMVWHLLRRGGSTRIARVTVPAVMAAPAPVPNTLRQSMTSPHPRPAHPQCLAPCLIMKLYRGSRIKRRMPFRHSATPECFFCPHNHAASPFSCRRLSAILSTILSSPHIKHTYPDCLLSPRRLNPRGST